MKRLKCRFYGALFILLFKITTAGATSFDWAVIGNTDNLADNTGYGAVDYEYSIAKTLVTTEQYVEFLNAVAGVDTNGLYNTEMSNSSYYKGISISGGSGTSADPYIYSTNSGWEKHPVRYVSWYDALRLINWLHNGQLTGAQDNSTTEYGAYDLSLQSTNPENIVRLSEAIYWLPSNDEWYKAAYYDPVAELYYDYATGSDTPPSSTDPTEDMGNNGNFFNPLYRPPYYTTEVGAYSLSASPYGTYDQGGNLWEITETLTSLYPIIRGFSWQDSAEDSVSAEYDRTSRTSESMIIGFRIASFEKGGDVIPEPASIILFFSAIGGFLFRKYVK